MADRTVASIKKELAQIEKIIRDMLRDFESNTGLEINEIEIERVGGVMKASRIPAIIEVSGVKIWAEVPR